MHRLSLKRGYMQRGEGGLPCCGLRTPLAPRVLTVLACLALAFALEGCRYSEALYEIIDDPINGTYEPYAEPEYRDVPGAPEDPTRTSTQKSENENMSDQENTLPVYGADAPENGSADRRPQDSTSDEDTEATEGDTPQEESGESQNGSEDDGTGPTEGDGGETMEDPEGDPDPNEASGRNGTGQMYGQDGVYEELPEARAVAAVGQYALITQMLSGSGGLAAADQQWLDEVQAAGAFPGEGLEGVTVAWLGDGSAEGSMDVDALISSRADVLLADGVTVAPTADEAARLQEAGINVVYVPVLGRSDTADDDIVRAVQVVGQVLANRQSDASLDTAAMVENYLQWHNGVLDSCRTSNGGYSYKMIGGKAMQGIYQGTGESGTATSSVSDVRITTAYIDQWAASSSGTARAERQFGTQTLYLNGEVVDTSDGVGLSATCMTGKFALIDYYLQVSGVVNNAYDTAKPRASVDSSSDTTLPYLVVAGSDANLTTLLLGVREFPSALWFAMYGVGQYDAWTTVGDPAFPGMIVRSETIADSVVASAGKVNGLYNVGTPYSVWVVPSGMAGSWADGTVESFLLSLWTYGVFQMGGDISECANNTSSFYQLFYRMDAASQQQMLDGLGVSRMALCPTG